VKKYMPKSGRALSPIIATIVLCSVVLVVGISAWNFVYSVSDYLQTKYFTETKTRVEEISERFMVEHVSYVSYNATTDILHAWVYNYGSVDITVNVYVYKAGSCLGKNETNVVVASKGNLDITVSASALDLEEGIITIEVASRRQNLVYESSIL